MRFAESKSKEWGAEKCTGEKEKSAGRGSAKQPVSSGAAAQAVPDVRASPSRHQPTAQSHTVPQSPAPTRPIFSLSVPSFFSPLFSCRLCSSHVIDSSRHQRQEHTHAYTHPQAHTRATQQSHSFTAGIYRELKRREHVSVCVCVYIPLF